MLLGLVIRRVFVFVDLLLTCAVLAVAGLLVWRVLEPPKGVDVSTPELSAGQPEQLASVLYDVGPLGQYARIEQAKLFGPAGFTAPVDGAPEKKIEVPVEVVETKLNLALRGTVATSPTDRLASATIENKDDRSTGVYGLGQEIVPKVTLKEVYPREVIIENDGTREVLRMDDEDSPLRMASGGGVSGEGRTPSRVAPVSSPNRVEVKKDKLIEELQVNLVEITTKLKPELRKDDKGNVIGITGSNIEDIPLAKTLDLKNGDVLQKINGEKIDSEAKILQLVNQYRDQTSFQIEILRNGKPMRRTYDLR